MNLDAREHVLVGRIWSGVLGGVVLFLLFPPTRELFRQLTAAHPYLLGVLKIGALGAMGDMLAVRMRGGRWRYQNIGLRDKALVWGFLGLVFVVVFPIFSVGTDFLFRQGYLSNPFEGFGARALEAFAASSFMNLLFAPTMMVFHRITDMAIAEGGIFRPWSAVEMLRRMDWNSMGRIVFPSLLWFWIPAHTLTFILPPEFRIVSAALLAIALGFILSFASRSSGTPGRKEGR
ncbi:MAG TPA: hypothetical protein PL162_10370 [Synergistaceae bacterium]|nr:hypothetical protein [Synergistaceae bacterium]